MFYHFYDEGSGEILRVSTGVEPEQNKANGEAYFSSKVFYSPDEYQMNVRGDEAVLSKKPPVVVDPAHAIRRDRNTLLAATDWTQMSDAPLSDGQKQEARRYRQALRDMTSATPPVFPTPPAWLA